MERAQAILLLGPTSSGKTPLGELIEARGLWGRTCHHFDFGAHLRRIVAEEDPPDYLSREDVAFLYTVLNSGALLEDEQFHIAERILWAFIGERKIGRDAFLLLNGLPRHIGQAEDVDAIIRMQAVIELTCTPDAVLGRIRSNIGGDRSGRTDDDEGSVRNKLALYAERTAPLLKRYRDRGVRIETVHIELNTTPEDVWTILNGR